MKKIFVAMPVKDHIEMECLETLYEKLLTLNHTYELSQIRQRIGFVNLYSVRQALCKEFLETDSDYYFYFDSDQALISPSNGLELMVEDDLDIVSPIIVQKVPPHLPTCQSILQNRAIFVGKPFLEDYRKYPQDRPFEVYYSSGGFTLIKREVLKRISLEDTPFHPVMERDAMLSVDYSLFEKAHAYGFKCWIDPRIMVSHIGKYGFTSLDYYSLLDAGNLNLLKMGGK